MAKFSVSPEAREDLDQLHAYISEGNPEAADRVLEAALSTFATLARMPGMGRPRVFKHSELAGLRSFRIDGFRNYLIFYRLGDDGLEVVRVLHGARDLDALFSDDWTDSASQTACSNARVSLIVGAWRRWTGRVAQRVQ